MPNSKKESPPATKADIELLMDSIGKLYDATERWKHEIICETTDKFDFAVETMRRDLPAAKSDQIEVLVDRVARLEELIGKVRD
jgi:hypothetical protein